MSKEMPLLKLKNVSKFYYNKGLVATGFTRVSLDFNLGEFVVITGESGSGKSTLLNVLSGLDSYEEGEMYINGEETSHYNEGDFEHYRKTYVGNIFQSFNLVGSYTVYQNIELVLLLNGFKKKDIHEKIISLIKEVDLYRFRNTRVSKLSGGQKQRVAIARALAKDTPIIIADEPTGNLDSKSAKSIIKLLSQIAKEKLVIVVTHNYDQVEDYATRKIEMHDGKVREDITLKVVEKSTVQLYEYKDIKFTSKINLGIRNSFNILPKFFLMFLVFTFIITAFLGEYSVFNKLEEEEAKYGFNSFFSDIDVNRIVIKKANNAYFTDQDFTNIKKLNNFNKIEKDDLLLDSNYTINNDEYYLWGKFKSINEIKKVDVGRLPRTENEIVVKGYIYDYYLSNDPEELFNQKLYIYDEYGKSAGTKESIKVVGIIYSENYNDDSFYVSDSILEKIRLSTNEKFSGISLKIDESYIDVGQYDNYMRLVANNRVAQGQAIFPNDMNYLCNNIWCKNKKIHVEIKNIYYTQSLDLVIDNTYSKNNFNFLTGLERFDDYNGMIFISEEDYNYLYNKYTFQSSVFANDMSQVDDLAKELNNLGFSTLKIKDTIVNPNEGILEIINIFRIVVTAIMLIVLFFITYFVIKLIQKSKNVYYSTVRILGGSKKVIKGLISIELYTIYHLSFFSLVILAILTNKKIVSISFIEAITANLSNREFIIIYLILLMMSILLSFTYSRKLFKTSAMKAYHEEV